MTSKTISAGTLNLRFMQNAQRAEQSAQIKLETEATSILKDDSHWEVSREVKDAWRISSTPSIEATTHESSYLPFMLSSTGEASTSTGALKLRGRRAWNKRGEEIAEDESAKSPEVEGEEAAAPSTSERSAVPKRLTTISGSGASSSRLAHDTKKPKGRTKTAQQLIREGNVGVDLRTSASSTGQATQAPSTDTGFMKPAGVVEPAGRARPADQDVVLGARIKDTMSSKRRRDDAGGAQNGEEEKKRKKKKKAVE